MRIAFTANQNTSNQNTSPRSKPRNCGLPYLNAEEIRVAESKGGARLTESSLLLAALIVENPQSPLYPGLGVLPAQAAAWRVQTKTGSYLMCINRSGGAVRAGEVEKKEILFVARM